MVYPGPAFIRMLRSLRETMAILAAEPVMVDTGQYQPVYRQRTYQDMENEIANSLSQLPNYHARVKLLTGEHTIRTHPAAPLLPEAQINERIAFIKKRMREQGYCKPAHDKPGHDVLYTSGSVSRLDFLGRNPLSWPSHQLLKTSLCTTPCSVLQNFDSKIIVAA